MGYTQTELGEKLGLKASAIAKYENGRVKNMKRSVIAKMAKVLDCSPSYLMGLEEENQSRESPPKILQYYEMLNDIGKHEATKRVEEMTHLSQYKAYVDDYLEPDAAHPDEENTNISSDMIREEDEIMDDENF